MILRISGHDFHYECENLCRVFFPNEKINIVYDGSGEDPITVVTEYSGGRACVSAEINGEKKALERECDDESAELTVAKLIFSALSELTGYVPPWGVLTGVRPSKLMLRLIADMGEEEAVKYFTDDLLVSRAKTELAVTVAK